MEFLSADFIIKSVTAWIVRLRWNGECTGFRLGGIFIQ